jgi:hypothetical protein
MYISALAGKIPYSIEQGIYLAEQGISASYQGNRGNVQESDSSVING